LQAGDGVAVEEPGQLRLEGLDDAEVLLFDMAL
jgi:quercetinase-like protein